jgi:DNA polymerase-4
LASSDYSLICRIFGKKGHELKERALGIDNDPVSCTTPTRSVSAETTLINDSGREDILLSSLQEIAGDVASRLMEIGISGKTISVKFRLADFRTFTRQITISTPTQSPQSIYNIAKLLLRKELKPGLKFRLLGIRVNNFGEEYQLNFISLSV